MERLNRARRFYQKNRQYVHSAAILDLVYFFSCMGDRLWTISIAFFVSKIGGLPWVALGQLIDSMVKVLVLPMLGGCLDKMHRHKGMQLILACNNLLIVLSAISFFINLSGFLSEPMGFWLLVCALVFNAFSRVASEAQKAAFMKDWIVVIVKDSKRGKLSTHNAVTNALDQLAACFAPLLCGEAISFVGEANACLFFLFWNVMSWLIEALLARYLYKQSDALQSKETEHHKDVDEPSCKDQLCQWSCSSLPVYFRQKALRPALSLALLFLTVLGFDNIAIAYGQAQGLSPAIVGRFRAVGAFLGTIGALTYRVLSGMKMNVLVVGFVGLVLQNIFLNLTTLCIFMPGNPFDFFGYMNNHTVPQMFNASMQAVIHGEELAVADPKSFGWIIDNAPWLVFFFLGITGARFGLWIADPSITEILQETVPERERYRVNLVQSALQEFFSVIKDLMVLALPHAATFSALIVMSVAAVFIGFLLYTSYFLTEGCPCKRQRSRSNTKEKNMQNKIELLIQEPGTHFELENLLSEREAPLATNRTDAL